MKIREEDRQKKDNVYIEGKRKRNNDKSNLKEDIKSKCYGNKEKKNNKSNIKR